jgi:hypothetical protein
MDDPHFSCVTKWKKETLMAKILCFHRVVKNIEGWLKIICTSFPVYSQIWLNLPLGWSSLRMDNQHFGYKTTFATKNTDGDIMHTHPQAIYDLWIHFHPWLDLCKTANVCTYICTQIELTHPAQVSISIWRSTNVAGCYAPDTQGIYID